MSKRDPASRENQVQWHTDVSAAPPSYREAVEDATAFDVGASNRAEGREQGRIGACAVIADRLTKEFPPRASRRRIEGWEITEFRRRVLIFSEKGEWPE